MNADRIILILALNSFLLWGSCFSVLGQSNYFEHSLDIDSMPDAYRCITTLNESYYAAGDVTYVLGDSMAMSLSKYTKNGNFEWNKQFGDSGNYYSCTNIIALNNDLLAFGSYRISSSSDYNLFMGKFDSTGNNVWMKFFGFPGTDETMYDVIETMNGEFLLIATGQTSGLYLDAYVVRVDSNGNLIWEKHYGLNGIDEYGVSARELANQDILISGAFFDSSLDWEKYLFKIDKNGELKKDTTWGVNNKDDRFTYISPLQNNYSLLIGGVELSSTTRLVHLFAIDSNGDEVWNKELDYQGQPAIWASLPTIDGTTILFGGSFDTTNYSSVYLLKITPRGDTIWSRSYRNQTNRSNFCYEIIQETDSTYTFVGFDHPLSANSWIKKLDCMGCDSVQCYFPDSCFVYDCHNDYPPVAEFSLAADTVFYKEGDTVSVNFTNSGYDAAAYTWHFGTGDSLNLVNPSYDFTQPGDYEITLVARNLECTDTAKATLYILDATGIDQDQPKTVQDELIIFPNPNNGRMGIKTSTIKKSDCSLEIYYLNGKMCSVMSLPNGYYTKTQLHDINLEGFHKGKFIVKLVCEGEVMGTGKVIVK